VDHTIASGSYTLTSSGVPVIFYNSTTAQPAGTMRVTFSGTTVTSTVTPVPNFIAKLAVVNSTQAPVSGGNDPVVGKYATAAAITGAAPSASEALWGAVGTVISFSYSNDGEPLTISGQFSVINNY